MRKLGFTLAEVLISLTVVGVVSALTVPLVSNLIPDKDKINVLNTYNKIAKLTQNLLEDPTAYYPEISTSGSVIRAGLFSPTGPKEGTAIIEAYPNNLSKLITESNATDDGNWTYSFECDKDIKCQFHVPQSKMEENAKFGYDFDIILLYKNKANPCAYSASCPKPDKYSFEIDNWGNITPVDPLSQAFLLNQLNMSQKKEDYAKAKEILKNQ